MKRKKLLAVLLTLTLTFTSLTLSIPAAAAGTVDEDPVGLEYYDDWEEPEDTGSTNHCEDWAYYHVQGISNYFPSTPVIEGFIGWDGDETPTIEYVAPEDLQIVGFRFIMDAFDFKEASCFTDKMVITETNGNVTGEFFSNTPVTVKKDEPMISAVYDAEEWFGQRFFTLYCDVLDLKVSTPEGIVTLIRDGKKVHETETTAPAETVATSNAGTYSLKMQSNYNYPAVVNVTGNVGQTCTLSFYAHKDWEIINLQFTLYNNTNGTISNARGFDRAMMINNTGDRLLCNISSLEPYIIEKGEAILTFDFNTDTPFTDGSLYLYIEDMTAITDKGETLIFQNGEKTPDAPEILFGDTNGNGVIDIGDVTTLQKHLADFKNEDGTPIIDETDPDSLAIADVTFDGAITVKDVTEIQRYLAEYITSFVPQAA